MLPPHCDTSRVQESFPKKNGAWLRAFGGPNETPALPEISCSLGLEGHGQNFFYPTGDVWMWLLGFNKFRETSGHVVLATMLYPCKMIHGSPQEKSM